MNRKRKKENNKESKEEKLGIRRSFSNNMFALKLIFKVSPAYVITYIAQSVIGASLSFISGSWLLREIVNGLQTGTMDKNYILRFIVIIAVVQIFISFIENYLWNRVYPKYSVKITAEIQRMLFEKSLKADLSCYEDPGFYDKYVKAMDEANDRVRGVLRTLDEMIWCISSLSLNSFLLFIIDPVLILFGLIPFLMGLIRKKELKVYHNYVIAQKPIDRRKKYIRRTFYLNEYAKEMRLTGMQGSLLSDFHGCYGDYKSVLKKYGIKRTILGFIVEFGTCIGGYLSPITYSVYRTVVSRTMLIGDCIVVINSIGSVSYSLRAIVDNFTQFYEHAMYIEDMRTFLNYEPAIQENVGGEKAVSGDISFEKVSFTYKGAENQSLHDLSFKIKKGERIALVGLNGSGKTTLVKLLMHLYEPDSGTIKLSGKDICDYSLQSYREQFSVVFQDYKCLSLTIAENVLMRPLKEGDKEIAEKALKQSGAYDKVESFEKGVDTVLTKEFDEKGEVLSGGEAQKVQLARVFAEGKPIVILDEPSSALDPIAEYTMFENMIKATEGKTVIFISHRLSSAVIADRVLVMKDGTLAESGSHEQLMNENSYYADMFRKQAQNYLGEEDEMDA